MRLLSIDPGYDKTGFAVFESSHSSKTTFLRSGIIKTTPKQSIDLRLKVILEVLETVIADDQIDTMVMEQLFFFKNQKTVIPVAQSQGVILLLSAQHNLPVSYITPLQIKQTITGYGNADKKNVLKMIQLILKQNLVIEDDDQSDAIACGLAYCYLNRNLIG
jgi:crossover junction endodeoxyribonuclease RuvC